MDDINKSNAIPPNPADMRLAWLFALERAKKAKDVAAIARAIGELGKLGLAVSYFQESEAGNGH